jgi:hypothetical protein
LAYEFLAKLAKDESEDVTNDKRGFVGSRRREMKKVA